MPPKKPETEELETEIEIEETETPPAPPKKAAKIQPLFPPQPKTVKEPKEEPFATLADAMKPVTDILGQVNERLAKAFPDPLEPAPKEEPAPKRGYRLFDEFDPTLDAE